MVWMLDFIDCFGPRFGYIDAFAPFFSAIWRALRLSPPFMLLNVKGKIAGS